MPKVLISDKLSPKAADIFRDHSIDVDVKPGMSPEELKACIGQYDGLAIRSATTVTPEIIEAAQNLKVVGRAGIGVDNVNIPAATARGIIVMNTPFGNSVTTAEHSIAMMMALVRRIPQANASTHAGKWEKSKFMGTEICSKTLGLIGCGNIGSIVAGRAQGLKMKVIAYDPYLTPERAADLHLEKVELDALLARADVITLHTPLNDATRGILGAENLAKTKPGVFIVNCARGGLVIESDLKAAIESGHVAGAALDVFEQEPAKENPLFGMEQVVCTPHLGASTTEAQENVALQVAEQMAEYLNHGTVTNALNVPSVSAEEAEALAPYLALADQLGSLAGQVITSGFTKVRVEFEGHAATLNTKPLAAAALKGLLTPLTEGVNMVNAPVIASERGLEVSELTYEKPGDYATLIRITLDTEQGRQSIAGTLFDGRPRTVDVHGIRLEAGLGRYMLYVNNEDKPGLIGDIGKVLGDAGINIANFHLGRGERAEEALALVEVDTPVPEDIVTAVSALPSVKQARMLQF